MTYRLTNRPPPPIIAATGGLPLGLAVGNLLLPGPVLPAGLAIGFALVGVALVVLAVIAEARRG